MTLAACASARELLEVYRRRAAHVADLRARLGEKLDPILREDVYGGITELVAALEHGHTTRVRIWSASASDGRSFLVFEDAEAQRILTCLKALDQRVRPYGVRRLRTGGEVTSNSALRRQVGANDP